jgi:hypothetical protein
MDPYLEGSLWTTVHHNLSSEIVRQLLPKLRPKYVALPIERLVYDEPETISITARDMYPDVGVVGPTGRGTLSGGTATLAPLRLATVMPLPVPHVTVEIRDVAHRRLVTAIEFLSPTNKRGNGRKKYLAKRRRLLLSSVHLLEIDLLRTGQRLPMEKPLPAFPYFVFLSRAEDRPFCQVWPIALDQRLPVVPVPLLEGDADVTLDLQAAFRATYELGYDILVSYDEPPDVPLSDEDMAWAGACIQATRSNGRGDPPGIQP